MIQQPHKLHVKIGESEFTAEGTEQVVKDQFDLFLMAIKHSVPQGAGSNGVPGAKAASTDPVGDLKRLPAEERVTLDRIFNVDENDLVSLKAIPKGENSDADGLIVLLYGFLKMVQKDDIYAPTLMAAAKQSGIQAERMYRIMESVSQYTNTAGQKRGRRYSLNNKGLTRAGEIIQQIVAG